MKKAEETPIGVMFFNLMLMEAMDRLFTTAMEGLFKYPMAAIQ
jgi:hypothetical protein